MVKEVKKEQDFNKIPSVWSVAGKEIWRDKVALLGLILFIATLGIAFIVGGMLDADYVQRIHVLNRDRAPGTGFGILGTDDGGRDMLRMLFLSTRNSLALAFIVTITTFTIGYTVGLFAGFYGGYTDMVILRIIDFFVMVPTIMVIIVANVALPVWNVPVFAAVLILMNWFTGARLLRARTLQESAKDYVLASKTLGTPNIAIIFKKILPNVVSIMLVNFILGLANSIGLETGLTVIGYGLPFGIPSIGRLIALARNPIVLQHRPWQWVPAVIVIVGVTLCIYAIGAAVRRAVNPRQRR